MRKTLAFGAKPKVHREIVSFRASSAWSGIQLCCEAGASNASNCCDIDLLYLGLRNFTE
jgi:hypothetical protein